MPLRPPFPFETDPYSPLFSLYFWMSSLRDFPVTWLTIPQARGSRSGRRFFGQGHSYDEYVSVTFPTITASCHCRALRPLLFKGVGVPPINTFLRLLPPLRLCSKRELLLPRFWRGRPCEALNSPGQAPDSPVVHPAELPVGPLMVRGVGCVVCMCRDRRPSEPPLLPCYGRDVESCNFGCSCFS